MNNQIVISACDNELYLVAVEDSGQRSFELCHLLSGFSANVSVTINLAAGDWTKRHETIGNGQEPVDVKYDVQLPSGSYTLLAVGINWGGPGAFSLKLDGQSYSMAPTNPTTPNVGVVWTPLVAKKIVIQ